MIDVDLRSETQSLQEYFYSLEWMEEECFFSLRTQRVDGKRVLIKNIWDWALFLLERSSKKNYEVEARCRLAARLDSFVSSAWSLLTKGQSESTEIRTERVCKEVLQTSFNTVNQSSRYTVLRPELFHMVEQIFSRYYHHNPKKVERQLGYWNDFLKLLEINHYESRLLLIDRHNFRFYLRVKNSLENPWVEVIKGSLFYPQHSKCIYSNSISEIPNENQSDNHSEDWGIISPQLRGCLPYRS